MEVKLEVGYMCLYQRMTYLVAKNMIKWYFPVFSEFLEVIMEVNDLRSQIFFVTLV